MRTIVILLILSTLLFVACEDEGNIIVQNKVHNATLTQVSWGTYHVASSLLPGEKSSEKCISDKKDNFPKIAIVKFYLNRDDKQVYLETKQMFTLNGGQNLLIVISDTTSVVNPYTVQ